MEELLQRALAQGRPSPSPTRIHVQVSSTKHSSAKRAKVTCNSAALPGSMLCDARKRFEAYTHAMNDSASGSLGSLRTAMLRPT